MRALSCSLLFLCLISGNAMAAGLETFGKWGVLRMDNGDGLALTTSGDSKLALGFRCFAKAQKCVHILRADINCEDKHNYPILVNSDKGAGMVSGICGHSSVPELYLTPYDKVHALLDKGSVIGFAVPMKSGLFKAVRFSLQGSSKAMERAQNIVSSTSHPKPASPKSQGASYF